MPIFSEVSHFKPWKVRVTIAVGLALGVTFLLSWAARDRKFRFDASDIVDMSEVRSLASLAEDLRRITQGDRTTLGPESARAAASWVRQTVPGATGDWAAMLAPGADAKLRHASLNGTLMILSQHAGEISPRAVREAKTDDEAAGLVLAVLRSHVAARRERDAVARLADAGLDPIWNHRGWPRWPRPARPRRAIRSLLGRPDDDQQYVAALIHDLAPMVRLAAWYDALTAFDEQPLGDPSAPGLWMVHDRTQGLETGGWASRVDVRLDYHRPSTEDGRESLVVATGLRLYGVRAEPDGGPDAPTPRLEPASGQLSVDVSRFVAFLQAVGLPEAFDVVEVTPRRSGRGPSPVFAWDLTLRHREYESFVLRDALEPGQSFEGSVRDLGDRVRARLAEHLLAAKSDRGWMSSFRAPAAKEAAGTLVATLSSPRVRPIPFSVRIGEDGHLSWSEQAGLAERRALASLLADRVRELDGLEGRICIRGLSYERTGRGRLRGDFYLAGQPGRETYTFQVGPDGQLQTTLTALQRRALATAKRPPARPAGSDADPKTRRTVSVESVRRALDARYRAVDPLIEVEPGADGRSLSLGLKLADYPTILLGPIAVERGEDVPRVVSELLSAKSVAGQAAAQWGRSVENARWGAIRPAVRSWDPERGRATIECRLTLHEEPEIVVPWSDDLRVEDGRWRSDREERIALLVAPQLGRLTDSVRSLAASQGIDLEVEVDTDAFGPGNWLRLHPPTAAFRCRMEPSRGLGWKVGLENVRLDRAGLHINPAFSFQVRGSLPLPPTSPVVTLSDPLIRVDFAARDVAIEAKFTPPTLPAGKASAITAAKLLLKGPSQGSDGLRADNPWLHLAYAQGRLGGSLSRRELRGGAEVIFLRSREVASGRLTAQFPNGGSPSLHGRLTAGSSAGPSLPRLDGELWVDRQKGFEMTARFGVAGVRLHGRMALRMARDREEGVDEPRAEFDGEGRFPIVGRVAVTGVSDLEFRDPMFEAKGAASLGIAGGQSGGQLHYLIQVRRSGYICQYEWVRPGRKTRSLVFLGPTLDGEVAEEIEGQVRRAVASGPAPADSATLSPGQQAAIQAAPEIRLATFSLTDRPEEGGPSPTTQPTPDDLGAEARKMVRFPGQIESEIRNGHLIVRERSGGRVHLDLGLDRLGLGDRPECKAVVWLPADESSRCEVLILDFRGHRVLRAGMAGPTNLTDLVDLAPDLRELMPAMSQPPRQGLFQRVAIELVDARTLDPSAGAIRVSERAYRVSYRSPNLGPVVALSWIDPRGRPVTARVYERRIGADRHADLWPRLSRLAPEVDRASVVAAEAGESGRIALLGGGPLGKFQLWPDAGRPGSLTVQRVPGESRQSFVHAMASCAEASWRPGGPPLVGDRAWFGPEGTCVASEGRVGGWWFFPAAVEAARAEFKAGFPAFLDRDRFIAAHLGDTQGLWPERFASPETRKHITGAELAEVVVRAWPEAQARSWSAHPMGLLTRLALEGDAGPANAAGPTLNGSPSTPSR